ncbi:hypothetical protein I7I48_01123 [Histoplasma ohiense]|nr:hypothetical protein I7I48_01123 [Histoplasma ohiense (nom. inval.)]
MRIGTCTCTYSREVLMYCESQAKKLGFSQKEMDMYIYVRVCVCVCVCVCVNLYIVSILSFRIGDLVLLLFLLFHVRF